MLPSTTFFLLLVGILVTFAVSAKTKINAGIIGFGVSFTLGYWFFGLRIRDIVALFPTSSFFQIMAIAMFFGFVVENGAIQKIGTGIVYRFRNSASFVLVLVMFLAAVVMAFLCGSPIPPLIVLGMIFLNVTKDSGINPLIVPPVLCFATSIGSSLPTGDTGSVLYSILQTTLPEGVSVMATHMHIWGGLWAIAVIYTIIFFLFFRVYRIKGINVDKPEPLSAIQKKSLIIVACVFAVMIIPSVLSQVITSAALTNIIGFFDVQTCCIIGSIVMLLFKIANQRNVIVNQIPWNMLILFSGMSVLIALGRKVGAIDYLAALITENVPTILVYPVVVLICGFLSFFAGTFSTIFPMMAPLMVTLSTYNPALSLTGLLTVVIVGANSSSVSPFSGGGSTLLAASGKVFDENPDFLFNAQLIMAVVCVAITAVVSITGLFNIV